MKIINVKNCGIDSIIDDHFDFDLQIKDDDNYFVDGKKLGGKKKNQIILSLLCYLKDRGYVVKTPVKNSYNFYFFDDINAENTAINYAKQCPKGTIVFTDREGAYLDGVNVLKTEFNNIGDCAIVFKNK